MHYGAVERSGIRGQECPRHTRLPCAGRVSGHFRGLQRFARMIGRPFFKIFIFHPRLGQQQLMLWSERQIVRYVQVFEHLLRNAAEHRRRHLATLVESDR